MTANIRAGHARRACEVNLNRDQQQEPTESSPLLAMGTGRNLCLLGRGGCQPISILLKLHVAKAGKVDLIWINQWG